MTTTTKRTGITFAMTMATLAAGCGDGDNMPARELLHPRPIIPAMFYADSTGNPIGAATPDTATIEKVAAADNKAPVLAPDGTPVTWGQFRAASGTADVTCTKDGTRVKIAFEHLIPNGVYTGWLVFFEAPGFSVKQFDALTGMAPIGAADGAGSRVVADASGVATLETLVPLGSVTVQVKEQAVPLCLLDAYEVHLIAAYHLDGQTYGSVPGAPEKIAEQVAWMIVGGQAMPQP